MDPINYFLFHSGILLAVLSILMFLLGLLLGYLIWRKSDFEEALIVAQHDLDDCEKERRELERSLKAAQALNLTPKRVVATIATDGQTIRNRQQNYYEQYVKIGDIRHDKDYGYLYAKRPALVDDLIEIKGVGEALNEKLNEHGVYTFRQVATWDEAMAERFAERLESFKDRVLRDDWIGQAADLHFAKYGERL
jgi:predicted flap endonuclease-1-like 5' DNA nuclease